MPENFFGINAGKVWHALNKNGAMTASKIAKTARLDIDDVYGALGWLGREGKIKIACENSAPVFALAGPAQSLKNPQAKQSKPKK